MAIKVRTTGNAEFGRYLKALVCGEGGAGKTLSASTWKNPLYADTDGGLMVVAEKGLPYVEVRTSSDIKELRGLLDCSSEEREKRFGRPIDTIVVDTFDAWQGILIAERLKATKREALAQQDWGWLGERCKEIVNGFTSLNMHKVFLCHVKDTEDEDEGRIRRLALQGSIREKIQEYFDVVGVLRTQQALKVVEGPEGQNTVEKTLERVLCTRQDRVHPWLKDRSGKLPAEFSINFEDDFERLYSLVYSGVESLPASAEIELALPPEPEPVPTANTRNGAPSLAARREAALSRGKAKPAPAAAVAEEAPTQEEIDPLAAIAPQDDAETCAACGDPAGTTAAVSRIRFQVALCKSCFTDRSKIPA